MNPFLPSGNPQDYTLQSVSDLIHNATTIALDVAGMVATVYILIGAFNYLTAFGSEEKAAAGKTTITWAIAGLVLIILAQLVVFEIFNFVTATPPTF